MTLGDERQVPDSSSRLSTIPLKLILLPDNDVQTAQIPMIHKLVFGWQVGRPQLANLRMISHYCRALN